MGRRAPAPGRPAGDPLSRRALALAAGQVDVLLLVSLAVAALGVIWGSPAAVAAALLSLLAVWALS